MATERPYKIRKTWEDAKGQLSSYSDYGKAMAKVNEDPSSGYKVFKDGEVVYDPMNLVVESTSSDIEVGDPVPDRSYLGSEPFEDYVEKENIFKRIISKFKRG